VRGNINVLEIIRSCFFMWKGCSIRIKTFRRLLIYLKGVKIYDII